MPNHIKNVLKIKNVKNVEEIIDKFTITNENGEKLFDFNKIITMPETLTVTAGSIEDWAIKCALTYKEPTEIAKLVDIISDSDTFVVVKDYIKYSGDIEKIKIQEKKYVPSESEKRLGIKTLKELGDMYIDNAMKYNCTNWYDWCITNWGTKWNAYEQEIVRGKNYIKFYFETAWSTPAPIFYELSKLINNDMEIWYADEDIGSNCGKIYYTEGNEIFEDREGDRNFANRVWRM